MSNLNILLICVCLFLRCTASSPKEATEEKKQKLALLSNPNKKITSFIYHRFGDDRYPSTNISIAKFKAQLNYFKEENFLILNFSDAIAYLHDDRPTQKVAIITIDDGFKSFYENGLPLLEAFGFPATLFINTETVGGASYMTWEELKDAQARGIEIGNHTHSHAYFLNLPIESRYDLFRSEIRECQDLVTAHLGVSPRVFAYPYGEFDQRMKNIVAEFGFIAAAAQNSGVIYSGSDLMACPRFPMATGFSDFNDFRLKANTFPLRITGDTIDRIITNNYTPTLKLGINQTGLKIDGIQCFIQGGNCHLQVKKTAEGKYHLTAKPSNSLKTRRRTLYTITAQDSINQWHWFSYLWINPDVSE